MTPSPRRQAFDEESDLATRIGSARRDSDWGGHPRTHEEDVAWAAKRAAVCMAAATLRARDGNTGAHSDDVVHLCDAIAEELGVHGEDRAEMLAAAQLHDIGKVGVPPEVLDKPGPLDDADWALIREHTVEGEAIVESVPELHEVARLVRHSHERWDGGGYPDRLSGERIPLGSRIIFCADAFHAIRADRPYRRGRTARAALEEVKRNAGSQFDPRVADALVTSAGRMRSTVRAGGRGLSATLRSRRLMSLLLTLAIGGSALAAGGPHLLRGESASGADKPVPASGTSRLAGVAPTVLQRAEPAKAKGGKRASPAKVKRGKARQAAPSAVAESLRRAGVHGGSSPAPQHRKRQTPAGGVVTSPPGTQKRRPMGRPESPEGAEEAPGPPAQSGPPADNPPGRSEDPPGKPQPTSEPPIHSDHPKPGRDPHDKPPGKPPHR